MAGLTLTFKGATIMNDAQMQELILRELYNTPNREAVLTPSMFEPPIMLSNIFRLGCALKSRGFVSAPNRRMGGWHFRLLEPGVTWCQTPNQQLK